MNTMSKLFIELRAGLRSIGEDLENHEAVAQAAIRKLEDLRSRTAVESLRLKRQCQDLEDRIRDLDRDAANWRERARQVAQTDEAKALECVRRMVKCQQQRGRLDRDLDDNKVLLADMQSDLDGMENKLRELMRRRASFVVRETRVHASGRSGESFSGSNVDAAFDRWEQRILIQESRGVGESLHEPDRFEEAFRRQEETIELRQVLQQIASADQSAGQEKQS